MELSANSNRESWLESLWMRLKQQLVRWRSSRPARRLSVRETLSLGEKRQLFIVQCGERQLLIGAAGNFLTTLAELKAPRQAKEEANECA